ncbi:M20 family metallopeptidase [Ureibacillus chungkukjangi]|uniref:M20 family metallopeptidase n=1 Tax=Ureibacillus chungkukjangi TaxID=1202712 RepID=UPI00203D4B74|nr:M20 family metallopeptidase [Ureibacillus chungkukjangi]MCM3387158.1 M20 family metallopeptidase [Ureibacillus chungkukjangi]
MASKLEQIDSLYKQYENEIIHLADRIWDVPETRYQEVESAKILKTYLVANGFEIEMGIGGIDTAFVAKYGSTGPIIGILGEFDALPGLSQKAGSDVREALIEGGNGHGCGHNLLGTAGIGAVRLLKDLIDKGEVEGRIHYFGCPAEEGGSGKTFMVREGVFNNVDVALTWHPNSFTSVFNYSSLANYQVYFEFEGTASHAANSPHLGRSALDAVELMNVGVNYLREHISSNARVHYAVTNSGGISPNVVQANAEVLYLIRANTIQEVDDIYKRVLKIAEGAALMTETKVKVKFDKACSNYIANDTVNKIVYDKLQLVGLPTYSEEELDYAKKMAKTITPSELTSALQEIKSINEDSHVEDLIEKDSTFYPEVIPYQKSTITMAGSTDVADVSWVVPTSQFFTTCFVLGTPLHTWQLVSQGRTGLAHKGMLYASKVLALTAIELLENPELIVQAKNELREQTNGQYVNPIPKEVLPNMYG